MFRVDNAVSMVEDQSSVKTKRIAKVMEGQVSG